MNEATEIKEGAVGLFDILGYKQLLRNNEIELVVDLLHEDIPPLRGESEHWVKEIVSLLRKEHESHPFVDAAEKALPETQWLLFSDTILLAMPIPSSLETDEKVARWVVFLEQVLRVHCLLFRAGLPIRGAVSLGAYFFNEQPPFFVGKGLVEAYEEAQSQDWAGSVVCERAEEELEVLKNESVLLRDTLPEYVIRYAVPFKRGESVVRPCVNWPRHFNRDDLTAFNIREMVLAAYLRHNKQVGEREMTKANDTEAFILQSRINRLRE
ncbi:MAG TPA: hypothetical protein VMV72_01815 [Verrucomicrobiae bacterium]|nr:hypothetical protein [Verrucomicrobiae bacterium]